MQRVVGATWALSVVVQAKVGSRKSVLSSWDAARRHRNKKAKSGGRVTAKVVAFWVVLHGGSAGPCDQIMVLWADDEQDTGRGSWPTSWIALSLQNLRPSLELKAQRSLFKTIASPIHSPQKAFAFAFGCPSPATLIPLGSGIGSEQSI
jgi:hypothetical protein